MRPQAAKRPTEFIMPRAARHNDPSHVGSSDASDVTRGGSLACAVAEMCPVFAPCDGKEREGGRAVGGEDWGLGGCSGFVCRLRRLRRLRAVSYFISPLAL